MMAGMSGMTRRDVLAGGAAMAVTGGRSVAQGDAVTIGKAGGDFAGGAKVFSMSGVNAVKNANGSERKMVLDGKLATGEVMSMHESWSPEGTPAPTHRITHSEIVILLEGLLDFEHDGKVDKAVAGDVIYVAYGTNHAVRNVGPGTARYMVLQLGGDTK
jgi:quercetin dioxygenase-like cupin family protein